MITWADLQRKGDEEITEEAIVPFLLVGVCAALCCRKVGGVCVTQT